MVQHLSESGSHERNRREVKMTGVCSVPGKGTYPCFLAGPQASSDALAHVGCRRFENSSRG
jgi:hypothetical protein